MPSARCAGHYLLADRGRTGKSDLGHISMTRKRFTQIILVDDEVDHAQAGVSPRSAFAAFGIDALNVGVIAGICTATGIYFCANRLVPRTTVGRGDLEL